MRSGQSELCSLLLGKGRGIRHQRAGREAKTVGRAKLLPVGQTETNAANTACRAACKTMDPHAFLAPDKSTRFPGCGVEIMQKNMLICIKMHLKKQLEGDFPHQNSIFSGAARQWRKKLPPRQVGGYRGPRQLPIPTGWPVPRTPTTSRA